jgi:hypothetical protein
LRREFQYIDPLYPPHVLDKGFSDVKHRKMTKLWNHSTTQV